MTISPQEMFKGFGISQATTTTLSTEESEREAQRELRRANCGQFSVRVSAATGGWKRHLHTCGQWRDRFCERCYQDRKEKVYGTLLRIEEECDSPVAIRVTPGEAKALTRKMRDAGVEYKRYPTESGDDVVIFDLSEYEWYGSTIPAGELDLDELTATPERKRMSGDNGGSSAGP